METEAASLTEASVRPFPMVADWTVRTDMLGEEGEGPSGLELGGRSGLLLKLLETAAAMGFLGWQVVVVVVVEMAVAREMGIRHKPLP